MRMKYAIWFLLFILPALHAEEFSLEHEIRYLETLDAIMNKIDKSRLTEMGQALFIRKCAFCHGKDGRGRQGFAADLTRRISKESAKYTIQNGGHNFRKSFPGSMPPMVPESTRADIIADYVARSFPEDHPGKEIFVKAYCKRCHGEDGRGIKYRAPNIRQFDIQTIAAILKNGKKGIIGRMPSYTHFAPYQVTMLALYIMQISENGHDYNTTASMNRTESEKNLSSESTE